MHEFAVGRLSFLKIRIFYHIDIVLLTLRRMDSVSFLLDFFKGGNTMKKISEQDLRILKELMMILLGTCVLWDVIIWVCIIICRVAG